jgi:MYXO-CTERM domain-containing protein
MDSGPSPKDSGSIGNDSGSASGDASDDGGSNSGGVAGDNGGCGCRTVASNDANPWALLGAAALGSLLFARRRRRS